MGEGRLVVTLTAAFSALSADDLEQQLGGDFCQGDIAEFIDNN